MVAIASSFAASTPIQAGVARSARSEDDARLVVSRSANFGTFQYLNLFVDGVHVADLGLGQSYDALLPPGQHVLSVNTTPQTYRRTPGDSTTRYRRTRRDLRIYRVLEKLLQGLPREERQHQANRHTEQPRLRCMRSSVLGCY